MTAQLLHPNEFSVILEKASLPERVSCDNGEIKAPCLPERDSCDIEKMHLVHRKGALFDVREMEMGRVYRSELSVTSEKWKRTLFTKKKIL